MLKNSLYFFCLLLCYSFIPKPLPEGGVALAVQDTVVLDTLQKDTLAIEAVVVEKQVGALEKLEAKKAYHKEIFLLGDNKGMVSLPITGGIAINIQKLYNHFSRRGRGARRLERTFEREYEDDLVDSIWNPLLAAYTTLRGDSLTTFSLYAKPPLAFIAQATDYERVEYLLHKLKNYQDSTEVIHRRFMLQR